jgi:hypothetical protein
MTLPTDSLERKRTPIFRGFLAYFPDAIAAAARLSHLGNEKHNPGQEIHWSRGISDDQTDALLRHILDAGPDWTGSYTEQGEEVLHAVAAFWRAGAMAQIAIERARGDKKDDRQARLPLGAR